MTGSKTNPTPAPKPATPQPEKRSLPKELSDAVMGLEVEDLASFARLCASYSLKASAVLHAELSEAIESRTTR